MPVNVPGAITSRHHIVDTNTQIEDDVAKYIEHLAHAPVERLFTWAAVAISYFAYNFIKIHTSLRMSPAMAAGITARLFPESDLVAC